MSYEKIILIVYLSIIVFMSIVSFFIYGLDKSKAKNGGNRIKEKTLLQATVFGGAIGAFLARIIFRHKTDKLYFSLTIYFSILLEILTGAFLIYMSFGGGLHA